MFKLKQDAIKLWVTGMLIIVSVASYMPSLAAPSKNPADCGVIIGLARPMDDDMTNYRTLWITNQKGKLSFDIKSGCIITPYGKGFWQLEPRRRYRKISGFRLGDECIFAHPLGQKTALPSDCWWSYVPGTHEETIEEYDTIHKRLLFVGNQYICMMDQCEHYGSIGGGTMGFSGYGIRLYKITNLNEEKDGKKLKEMIGSGVKPIIDGLHTKYHQFEEDKIDNGWVKFSREVDVDGENMGILRNGGRWAPMLPIKVEAIDYGLTSERMFVDKEIPLSLILPKSLTSYDKLVIPWERLKQAIPNAIDAVSSPNGNLLIVQTRSELLIFPKVDGDLSNPLMTVHLSHGEAIILHQWATGDYVGKWDKVIGVKE
jgi:hypothetical protein